MTWFSKQAEWLKCSRLLKALCLEDVPGEGDRNTWPQQVDTWGFSFSELLWSPEQLRQNTSHWLSIIKFHRMAVVFQLKVTFSFCQTHKCVTCQKREKRAEHSPSTTPAPSLPKLSSIRLSLIEILLKCFSCLFPVELSIVCIWGWREGVCLRCREVLPAQPPAKHDLLLTDGDVAGRASLRRCWIHDHYPPTEDEAQDCK